MSEILHTNIFFVITSVAVIVITALLVVVLIYVIRVIRDLSHISENVRRESDEILQDVSKFRADIKSKALGWKGILMRFLKKMAPRRKSH